MKLLRMQFLKDVLILVLLELSLWEAGLDFSQYSRKEVLILVLLELSLWAYINGVAYKAALLGLNPCFTGT